MYASNYKKIVNLSTLSVDINSSVMKEIAEFSLYSAIAFFMPFMLFGSQFFLGTIVNMSLISGALYVKGKKLIPLMMLPSLGVLSRGMMFGPMTIFLVYMIPFIWIGNFILIFSVKFFHLKLKKSYSFSSVLGSGLKFAFLFSSALVLYVIGAIPVSFLIIMGLIQLVTAVSASIAVFPINKIRKKLKK